MKRTSLLVLTTVVLVLMLALAAPAATVSCTGVAAWSANNVAYAAGALVTYNGSEYKCLQAHTSQAGWDPVDVPALWSLVGTCSTGGATPTPTPTPTTKPTATATATAKPTATATATAKPTATATATAKPTATATATAKPTATPTATAKPTATATPTGGSCWPAWSVTATYSGGAQVSLNNENYQAAFYSQNQSPATNSGPSGSGEPWIPEGACTAGPTPTPSPTPKPTPTATPCSGCTSSLIFSPYKDITVDANWNTGAQQTTASGASEPVTQAMPNSTLTWAFATGTCGSETWAGITPALEVSNVQAFVSAGKKYIISTGGAAGSFDCPSASAFASFINTYNSANMLGVDFDIESGQSQAVISDLVNAVKGVQGQFPNMRFSFTVASFGTTAANPIFNATGVAVINTIKSAGLGGHWTINPMAFDFGSPNASYCTVVNGTCEMGESAIGAMEAVNQQYGVPYGNIEVTLEVPTDDGGAPFTMSDVNTVCSWIRSNGVAGIHFWSLDRDTGLTYTKAIPSACGTN